jgi:hypothetical protein
MAKIIHVHIMGKRKDYYFGSISAVFDYLTEEEVGVTKSYLLHAGLSGGGTHVTKKAIIKQGTVLRKKRTSHKTPDTPAGGKLNNEKKKK